MSRYNKGESGGGKDDVDTNFGNKKADNRKVVAASAGAMDITNPRTLVRALNAIPTPFCVNSLVEPEKETQIIVLRNLNYLSQLRNLQDYKVCRNVILCTTKIIVL